MQSVGRGEAKTILLTHEGFQPVSGMVRDLTPRRTQLFAIKTPRETNAPLCLVRVSSRALTQKAECQQEGLKQGMERRLWKEQKQICSGRHWENWVQTCPLLWFGFFSACARISFSIKI